VHGKVTAELKELYKEKVAGGRYGNEAISMLFFFPFIRFIYPLIQTVLIP